MIFDTNDPILIFAINHVRTAYAAGGKDMRDLLKKYINHVGETEGTTFIKDSMPGFTPAEIALLNQLADEP